MKKFVEFEDKIKAVFTFNDFLEAIDFVNQVADLAMQADHHPDILLHDVKSVTITLTTHSEGKVTQKDWDLADQIEAL